MIQPYRMQQAIRPLRIIFWGVAISLITPTIAFNMAGRHWSFPLPLDTLGCVLIAWSVFHFTTVEIGKEFSRTMWIVFGTVAVATVITALQHFAFFSKPLAQALFLLFGFVQIGTAIGFIVALQWLCQDMNLRRSAGEWKVMLIVFIVCLGIPNAGIGILNFMFIMRVSHLKLLPSLTQMIEIPLTLAALLYFYWTTTDMQREITQKELDPIEII